MNHKILCSVATLALVLVGTSANAQYSLSIDSATAAPGDTVTLAVTLDSSAGDNLQGWSYGVCHDSSSLTILASDANSLLGPLAATANGGSAPDFVQGTVEAGGYALGVVISLLGANTLPPGSGVVSSADYTNDMPDGGSTTVSICDTLGTPPVASVVVVGGASLAPTTSDGTVTSVQPEVVAHINGDANQDNIVNLADGIWILNYLYQGGPGGSCAAADDANDDGGVDAADAVYIIQYQFLGGAAPAAPFPDCGLAAGQEAEDCLSHSACP